ncbi:MAG: T9SS type A sorting domain-containing protein [Bacteroidia bacterium]
MMQKNIFLSVFLLLLFSFAGHAQYEILSPLHYNPAVAAKWHEQMVRKHHQTNYTQGLTTFKDTVVHPTLDSVPLVPNDTLSLPFLDDFSKDTVYPDQHLWMDKYAYVNPDFPIAPVTIGVATLDGLNAQGYPYNFNSVSGSFAADQLTSNPINLGTPLTAADSIYLSFYYQAQGRGISPKTSDSILLEFKAPNQPTQPWKEVWFHLGYSPAPTDSAFHLVMVPITDTAYLHNGFQFRFQNYASLNGPFNQWNIDYVYLNKLRSQTDTVFKDVAFVYKPQSLIQPYESMPWEQYTTANMRTSVNTYIRNNDNAVDNTSYYYDIRDAYKNVLYTYPVGSINVNPYSAGGYDNYAPQAHPPVSYQFPLLIDSTNYQVEHVLNTTPDFDRSNDTIRAYQVFKNYYAYDDGSAELAYGLNQAFAKLAYRYVLNVADTLLGAQIYFDPAGVNTAIYSFRLAIWADAGGIPASTPFYIDSSNVPIYQPNGYFMFDTYNLKRGDSSRTYLHLNAGTYYIGMIQEFAQPLNIGFDENTDSHTNLYYNVTGTWQQSGFQGSLMFRPVFGNFDTIPALGVKELSMNSNLISLFPNPANTFIHINCSSSLLLNTLNITIYDAFGRNVLSNSAFKINETLDISALSAGIYFVKIQDEKNNFSVKKLVITR